MNARKTLLSSAMALAMGGISLSANAALTTSAVLNFDPAEGSCVVGGTWPYDCSYGAASVTNGSYFTMDGGPVPMYQNASDPGYPYTTGPSGSGVHIGAAMLGPVGNHTGSPDGTETPELDAPWKFFSNTGMHWIETAITVTNDAVGGDGKIKELDFSGWRVGWGDVDNINMGGDTANFTEDTGLATITCDTASCSNSSTFVLDYAAHVPLGDASGFGGTPYTLHLEGTVSAVPVPAAAWLFGSGLVGLAGVARRRKNG